MAAANLSAGSNVLYITMEMSEERIAERIDANLLDTNIHDLEHIPKDVYLKKVNRIKAKTEGRLIIKEYPTSAAGAAHFRHLLHELKIKKNFIPDIIYIDYLNICVSSRMKMGGTINSYSYIKSIAEEVRGLSIEFDVPIVTATQSNRDGTNNTDIDLTNVSESHGLSATVDLLIALISTDELEEMGQYLVKQLKNRFNDLNFYKRFVVGVDKAKMKLYDVEESAQEDIVTSVNEKKTPKKKGTKPDTDKPLMDNTSFGERDEEYQLSINNKGNRKDFSNLFTQ